LFEIFAILLLDFIIFYYISFFTLGQKAKKPKNLESSKTT